MANVEPQHATKRLPVVMAFRVRGDDTVIVATLMVCSSADLFVGGFDVAAGGNAARLVCASPGAGFGKTIDDLMNEAALLFGGWRLR